MTIDDNAWLAAAVGEHQQLVRNYVARRVDAGDVDDVVAEVFAALWRHRDPRPPEVRLWLLRAAKNVVLHQHRAGGRRARLHLRLADEAITSRGPDRATLDSEAAQVVRACMGRLRDPDRELLRLVYWENLSLDEIAFVVGASSAATRVRLHRARRRLAGLLPSWLGPPDPVATTTATFEEKS